MFAVRVKICGLTSVEDARLSCAAGADAIGLVFYKKSSRCVSSSQAKLICQSLPPFVQSVGLFVNEQPDVVDNILATVHLDLLQFHGDEDSGYCSSFARPYIKAIRMKPGVDVASVMAQHPLAQGFLLDAYTPGKPGGTGEVFDWQQFPQETEKPLILAGGLTPDNVKQSIMACSPYAVDVSGGVEAGPGRKSEEKITAFVRNAKKRCHASVK